MQNIYTTPVSSQKNSSLSFEKADDSIFSINGYSIDQYRRRLLSASSFGHLFKRYKQFSIELYPSNKVAVLKEIFPGALEEKTLNNKREHLFVEKPLEELENKIYNVCAEHQEKNWDGYGAEPIKYLDQSLQFAEDLFSESRILVESVDIIPENDGCLCFEWFKSDSKYINVAVKGDKLIYTYKLGDEKACGEVTHSGKQTIIEQIKKIA